MISAQPVQGIVLSPDFVMRHRARIVAWSLGLAALLGGVLSSMFPLAVFATQTPIFIWYLVAMSLGAVGFFVAIDRPYYPYFMREFVAGILLAFVAFGIAFGPHFLGAIRVQAAMGAGPEQPDVPRVPTIRELLSDGRANVADVKANLGYGDSEGEVIGVLGPPSYRGRGFLHYKTSDGAANVVFQNDRVVDVQHVPLR